MKTNIDKYRKDLKKLINLGEILHILIQYECYQGEVKAEYKRLGHESTLKGILEKYPSFKSTYQEWYSESQSLIRQLMPDRLDDFISYYKKSKTRRFNDIKFDSYKVEDYLDGLNITRGYEKEKVVGTEAAIPKYEQQLNILKSLDKRFESSLFDIKQLVQADLFDSELATAKELLKKKFDRAAGVIAGVVLEKHLAEVCISHNVVVKKKAPSINDYNQLLKDNEIIDTPDWRRIQLLGDIRNTCGHSKDKEPKKEDVEDLISGVEKVIKTIF